MHHTWTDDDMGYPLPKEKVKHYKLEKPWDLEEDLLLKMAVVSKATYLIFEADNEEWVYPMKEKERKTLLKFYKKKYDKLQRKKGECV